MFLLPMFRSCCSKQGNKEKPVSLFSNIGFVFGCNKTETMNRICKHWDNAGLKFLYDYFYYTFYVEQFLVNYGELTRIQRTNK